MKRERKDSPRFLKTLCFFCLALTLYFNAAGQRTATPVTGVVTDSSGVPLHGVSVTIRGTQKGTITNVRGEFTINAADGETLIFSIAGYRPETAGIHGNGVLRIGLAPKPSVLNDVVVIGYGTQKKADVTGSVASVKASDMADRITSNPLEALSGKVPGLSIYNNSGRPGGGISVNLRGFNSISASNSPLFVIDGIVGADFQSINPSDIEAVDVLKDASSTAIYGARGANGVIIITTKRARNGDFGIAYNGSVSANTLARRMHMLDSKGWMDWFTRAWAYNPDRGALPDLHADYPLLFNSNEEPIYNTDWQKEATQTGISHRHFVSLTQGTAKSRTGLYTGYQDDQGILLNTYYKKFSVRYNTEQTLRPWLTTGGDIAYNQIKTNQLDDYGVGGMTPTRMMIEMLPIFPVKYPDGTWTRLDQFGYNFDASGNHTLSGIYPAENPVRILQNFTNIYLTDQVLLNLYANVRLAKGLTLKSTYASQIFSQKNNFYLSKDLESMGASTNGQASVGDNRTVYWQAENYLTYDRTITGNDHLNAVLGSSWMSSTTEGVTAGATEFTTDYYTFNNLSAGSVPATPTSSYSNYKLNSYYGRLNYAYLDKYLFTFTGRYDGSSKFGDANKFAFFPSGAVGWILSKENFLAHNNFISFLKLRGSYGITGNSEIPPYSSLGNVGVYTIAMDNQIVRGTAPVSIPNPSLKWEQTAETDIGLDLKVLDNRLSATADYYKKKTTNLLLNVPVTSVTGYTSVFTNIGSLQNQGFELAVNGDVLRTRDLTWSLGAQFSTNASKILALGSTNADIYPGPNFLGQTNILQVGKPLGNFWGFKRLGVWGTGEAAQAALYGKKPGDIKRLDVNGDHVFDNSDAMVLGNMFPKYELDLTTTVRYHNFTLSADVMIRHGNKVMNVTTLTVEDRQYYANSYSSILKDAWTPEHQNTMVPELRFANVDPWGTDLPFFMDSRWVEDGSFVRGKSINLTYSVPEKQTKSLGLSGLRVYGNVNNFFLISRYRGFDPEVSTFSSSTFSQGIEFYGSPRPRTFTVGITANL